MRQKNKLFIVFALACLLLLILTSLSAIYYLNLKQKSKDPVPLIKEAESIISLSINRKVPDSIEKILDEVKNENKSKRERYEALKDIALYLSSVYDETHAPDIRRFTSEVLGKYAKENFPEYYNKGNFTLICSDPYCGEKIDQELEKILNDIVSSGIPNYAKDIAKYNLTLAGYIPSSELEEKRTGMSLTAFQLEQYGDPKASEAAKSLKSYFLKKYKTDLFPK